MTTFDQGLVRGDVAFDRDLARDAAETLHAKRVQLCRLDPPTGRGWQPLQDRVGEALQTRPASIADVVRMLRTVQCILDELPPSPAKNRVSAFNSLYFKITRRMDVRTDDLHAFGQQSFENRGADPARRPGHERLPALQPLKRHRKRR
jgi:hypothetical protein